MWQVPSQCGRARQDRSVTSEPETHEQSPETLRALGARLRATDPDGRSRAERPRPSSLVASYRDQHTALCVAETAGNTAHASYGHPAQHPGFAPRLESLAGTVEYRDGKASYLVVALGGETSFAHALRRTQQCRTGEMRLSPLDAQSPPQKGRCLFYAPPSGSLHPLSLRMNAKYNRSVACI